MRTVRRAAFTEALSKMACISCPVMLYKVSSEVLDDITAPAEGGQIRRGRVDVRAVDRNCPAGIFAGIASVTALGCAKPKSSLRRYSDKGALSLCRSGARLRGDARTFRFLAGPPLGASISPDLRLPTSSQPRPTLSFLFSHGCRLRRELRLPALGSQPSALLLFLSEGSL